VLASQLLDSSILFCCCYCLQAHNKHSNELHEGVPASLDEDIIQLWEHRCQSFVRYIQIGCCNLFGGNNIEEGFDQVAKVRTFDIGLIFFSFFFSFLIDLLFILSLHLPFLLYFLLLIVGVDFLFLLSFSLVSVSLLSSHLLRC
jgi:hypothetical protein